MDVWQINLSALFNVSTPGSVVSSSSIVKRIRWFFKQFLLNRDYKQMKNDHSFYLLFLGLFFFSLSMKIGLILGSYRRHGNTSHYLNLFYLSLSCLILSYLMEWHYCYSNIGTVLSKISSLKLKSWKYRHWSFFSTISN